MNGFGYGGTNAHAILAEAPEPTPPVVRRVPAHVLPVSGRNAEGARQLARELLPLVADPAADPVALADTMWSRRSHHNYRFAVPFDDRDDLLARLAAVVDGSVAGGRTVADGTAPVFVFSGMGPQWWRMGRDLLDAGGPFARAAAKVDQFFADLSGWSVIDEMRRDEADSRVTSTAVAQPANFLVQVGLAAELAALRRVPERHRRAQCRRGERCLRQRHAQPGRRSQGELPQVAAAGRHGRLGRDARRRSERGRGTASGSPNVQMCASQQ